MSAEGTSEPAASPTGLDAETQSALEWQALLSAIAGFCCSASGGARARALSVAPTLELARERNRVVAELLDLDRLGIQHPARAFPDVTQALELTTRGGVASAAELWQVRELLELAAELRVFARGQRDGHAALCAVLDSPPELQDLAEDLSHALDPDGSVADRASPELARARQRSRELREELKRRLATLIDRYADVVQGDYYTEREGRHVLPIRADAHLRVPGIVLGASASGATLFVEPEELTGLGNRLRIQEAEAQREAAKVLIKLSAYVASDAEQVRQAQHACEQADLLRALAHFARRTKAVVVELDEQPRLELRAARHPLLALSLDAVVENDMAIQAARALVISGPNAGGKTVALKTLGLCAWMARAGIPLPVAPESRVGWFSSVLADIGDEQSLARSLSTFSAHVQRLCALLEQASQGVLILLDEPASGTDPEEGAALAAAVLEALSARGAAVAVTTHYEKLKEFAAHAPHLHNASVSFDFERMTPTFRLTMGIPGASSALTVATRHGLPESVVARAKLLLPDQAHERERAVERLERERQLLEQQRLDLTADADRARQLREQAEAEQAAQQGELARELEQETRALRANVAKLRADLHGVRERLKANVADPKALRGIERDLSRVAAHVSLGGSLLPQREQSAGPPGSASTAPALPPGSTVRVKSSGMLASVLESDAGKVRIQVGSVKLTLRVEDVEPSRAPHKPAPKRPARRPAASNATLPVAVRTIDNTLDLRGERVEEALDKVDSFLDRLLNVGEPLGFVLHGHGTGALKAAVRAHLQASSYIERARAADSDSGGDAFTIFWLRS